MTKIKSITPNKKLQIISFFTNEVERGTWSPSIRLFRDNWAIRNLPDDVVTFPRRTNKNKKLHYYLVEFTYVKKACQSSNTFRSLASRVL